jgi:hypothetical protein
MTEEMRRRFVSISLLITVVHSCLLWLAIWLSFTLFKGPSTDSEIFWNHVRKVLQFPGSNVVEISSNVAWIATVWTVCFGVRRYRVFSRSGSR